MFYYDGEIISQTSAAGKLQEAKKALRPVGGGGGAHFGHFKAATWDTLKKMGHSWIPHVAHRGRFNLVCRGSVTASVPVLGCEGLPLRVKAAVDHTDQVVLAERPLCQGHGSQAGRLHTQQREHTVARDNVMVVVVGG